MNKEIRIDEFEKTIADILTEYGDEATKAVKETIPEVGKEVTGKIRSASPRSKGAGKHYKNGWRMKVYKDPLKVSAVIANQLKPGLTHLLEKGHQKRNGGWVEGIPHIKPAEEWGNEEVVKRIEKELGEID